MSGTDKQWLIWFRHGPFGTSYAREGLDVLLVMAAFDQRVSAFFERDALTLILQDRDAVDLGFKDFAKGFQALPLYGVNAVYYDHETLVDLGLTADRLAVEASPLYRDGLATFITRFDHILSF